ncbi:TPA: hypothetical protein ACX6PT_003225 [Photobacterium damselae]
MINRIKRFICFFRDICIYINFKKGNQNIKDIKSLFHGQRSFLIGSGPSIKDEDFLPLKNELILSLNNGFVHKNYKDYMIGDNKFHLVAPIHKPQSYNDWLKWFNEMELNIPINVKLVFGITGSKLNSRKIIEENNLFKKHQIFYFYTISDFPLKKPKADLFDIGNLIYRSPTASLYGLHFLRYLGVSDIYLLGLDHNYILFDNQSDMRLYSTAEHQTEDAINDVTNDFSVEYYFTQYKIFKYYLHFKRNFNSVNVYNCSMNSLLRVFNKIPLEMVLKENEKR